MKPENNTQKYLDLRDSYAFFEYQRYSFQVKNQILEIEYEFNISDEFYFKPTLKLLPGICQDWSQIDANLLNNLVFHIGMVELISYWKCTCSPEVRIIPFKLNDDQIKWWKKLYFHGLGEFFYLNQIKHDRDFMHITSGSEPLTPANSDLKGEKIIVPVGGGKDSVVSLEVLKRAGFNIVPMAVNPREAIERTIVSAGFKLSESFVVQRKIDPLLLELNSKGFLNGHTPFSAMLAFVTALVAVGSGNRYIALSNENSANESTVPGTNINHQYSKSVEFEEDFRYYLKTYMHKELDYFSFLRPLNELQISGLFSSFPMHFQGFRSCNVGSKEDKWCGKCPKCLFAYIMLSPFLNDQILTGIFGSNLLDDADLKPIFDELTGAAENKPFECVGTPEEIRAALKRTFQHAKGRNLPYLLRVFSENSMIGENDRFDVLLSEFNNHHFIPEKFVKPLKWGIESIQLNSFNTFLKEKLKHHQSILILGFGKEGQSSLNYLRFLFPKIVFGIADLKPDAIDSNTRAFISGKNIHTGHDYLHAIADYDLILKSPGVKLTADQAFHLEKISSQTELFLSHFKRQTIGVTGTKGKSTTSSLIFHLLKMNGKKTVLLGNIGVPAFDVIDDIDENTILVYELSAHQLQYLKVSPHVAVLLDIFPEHLDHFDHFENYKAAKENIFLHQVKSDILITSISHRQRVLDSKSKLHYFGEKKSHVMQLIEETDGLQLEGEHNRKNMEAAIIAVQEFGISVKNSINSLSGFKPLLHRLEYVGNFGGVDFINDSISTVPESAMEALKTHPDTTCLILGGFDRRLDYEELVKFVVNAEIPCVFLLGKAGEAMKALFDIYTSEKQKVFQVPDLGSVFDLMKQLGINRGKCLLSPAAASYDNYHNFEHRGDAFKTLSKSYISGV